MKVLHLLEAICGIDRNDSIFRDLTVSAVGNTFNKSYSLRLLQEFFPQRTPEQLHIEYNNRLTEFSIEDLQSFKEHVEDLKKPDFWEGGFHRYG